MSDSPDPTPLRFPKEQWRKELHAWGEAQGQLPAAGRKLRHSVPSVRRRRGGVWIAGCAATVVVALGALAFWRPAPAPLVATGEASPNVVSRIWQAPVHRSALWRVADGSSLRLGPGMRCAWINDSPRAPRIQCASGGAQAVLRRRWTVDAGPFTVTTEGAETRFQMSWSAKNQALAVDVDEGQLVVTGPCVPAHVLVRQQQERFSCPSSPPAAIPHPSSEGSLANHLPLQGSITRAQAALGTTSEDALDPDLVGHWTFDDPVTSTQAVDSSGHGNHMQLSDAGRRTHFAEGIHGGALAIEQDGFATIPASASLDSIDHAFTVATWMLRQNDEFAFDMIVSRQSGDTNGEHFGLGCYQNRLSLLVETQPPDRSATDWGLVPNHHWIHVAGTYDGKVAVLYLDGAEVAREVRTGKLTADKNPILVGANMNAGGRVTEYFVGHLDDLRLYRRALAAAEIARLAHREAATP